MPSYDQPSLLTLRKHAKRIALKAGLNEAEADDVAQYALLELVQSRGVQSPNSWVAIVAKRRSWHTIRRRPHYSELSETLPCPSQPCIDERIDLAKALNRLKPTACEIFLGREIDQCTFDELSEQTGLSISTLHRRMNRSVGILRRELW